MIALMSLRAVKLGPVFSVPDPVGEGASARTLTTRKLLELAAFRCATGHRRDPRCDMIEAAIWDLDLIDQLVNWV